jgi:hypothetical protein
MKFDGVIGAGWGRTGTLSLRVALENQLNFGPVMHTMTLFDNVSFLEHFNLLLTWIELGVAKRSGNSERVKKLLKRALGRFKSSVDFPTCMYFEELMELYPNRLVVLTVRDSPEEWYESFRQTVLLFVNPTPAKDIGLWLFLSFNPYGILISTFHRLAWQEFSMPKRILDGATTSDEEIKSELIQAYENWIDHVKSKVPTEKLIVFRSKQGWVPLVDKFGIEEVPSVPFPNVNDRQQIDQSFDMCRVAGWITLILYVVILILCTKCILGGKPAARKQKIM